MESSGIKTEHENPTAEGSSKSDECSIQDVLSAGQSRELASLRPRSNSVLTTGSFICSNIMGNIKCFCILSPSLFQILSAVVCLEFSKLSKPTIAAALSILLLGHTWPILDPTLCQNVSHKISSYNSLVRHHQPQ